MEAEKASESAIDKVLIKVLDVHNLENLKVIQIV